MSNWKNHQSIHDTLSLVFYRCFPIITNFFSSSQQHFPVILTALLALLTEWFTQYFRDIALNSCSSISNCLASLLFFIREASCGRKREHSQSSFIFNFVKRNGRPMLSCLSITLTRKKREKLFLKAKNMSSAEKYQLPAYSTYFIKLESSSSLNSLLPNMKMPVPGNILSKRQGMQELELLPSINLRGSNLPNLRTSSRHLQ